MKSLGKFPDQFLAEIAGQPDALRRAAAALAEQRGSLERIREAGRSVRRLVFTGMGSSYDACYPAVNVIAGRGVPALHVNTAELLHFRRPILSPQSLVTIVSQSGRSAEIVKLLRELAERSSRPFVLSVTNGLENELAGRADAALDTWAGPEAGPSTMTFVAALAVLSAAGLLLAGESVDAAVHRTAAAAERAALAVERLLEDPEASAADLAEWLGGKEVTVVVGRGPARAAAEMGALLLKECGFMAESLESATFRHGPLELAGPTMAAIVMATEPETRGLDLGLAAELADVGASVLVVTPDGEAPKGARAVATGDQDRALMPAVSIVPVQLLGWQLSVLVGRRPGAFTRASKVTTRE